jgi:hypothetical protein
VIGVLLLIMNFAILLLSGAWCTTRYYTERMQRRWRRALSTRELAIVEGVMGNKEESQNGHNGVANSLRAELSRSNAGGKEDEKRARVEAENAKVLEQYLLSPQDVTMHKKIGAGSFGEVFYGSHRGQQVAIKTMIHVSEEGAAFRPSHDHLMTIFVMTVSLRFCSRRPCVSGGDSPDSDAEPP